MALNAWWSGLTDQRYWMEITDREAPGDDLLAPQLTSTGRSVWSYSLVSAVRPGDRVLHYLTNAGGVGLGAIIGWSEVLGRPSEGYMVWRAHTADGRRRDAETSVPSWFAPLVDIHLFDVPVQRNQLSSVDVQLGRLKRDLEMRHGQPIYFPFYVYRPGEVRAQQGYLAKFPLELFGLFPSLEAAASAPDAITEDDRSTPRRVPAGYLPRIQDPALRSAIERRSLDVAIEYYEGLGATEVQELGKPYDISLTLDGYERHIEVKGSSLEITTIELTRNEVSHAWDFQPTDLVVVYGIKWRRMSDGQILANGGTLRVWRDWTPLDEDLEARVFAYYLPPTDA